MRLHVAGQGLSVFLRMQPRLTFGAENGSQWP